ncbi:hypothetical protein QR692_04655 [Lactococcus petauri]|jgi:hypothetical protein|uniref:hypothetical protein n=1 Tax=Lactococcus petauri TaxID=1940789 RepID=UPI002078E11E|nr:hypothetical protein [Lactococcus petauri]USI66594.1 hypothetical protein LMK05_04755 [Lactococcus petauri]USI69039.1 hypothetical protein LMK04_04690 [Lactococcus petauri]WJE13705.1 hypothetical protein QR692_04655 [Lactococcus petauri]
MTEKQQLIIDLFLNKIQKNILGYSERVQNVLNSFDYQEKLEFQFSKESKMYPIFVKMFKNDSLEAFQDYQFSVFSQRPNPEYDFLDFGVQEIVGQLIEDDKAKESEEVYQKLLTRMTGKTDAKEVDVINLTVAQIMKKAKPEIEKAQSFGSKLYKNFGEYSWDGNLSQNLMIGQIMDNKSTLTNIANKLEKAYWMYGRTSALEIKARTKVASIISFIQGLVSQFNRLFKTAQAVNRRTLVEREDLIEAMLDLNVPIHQLELVEYNVCSGKYNEKKNLLCSKPTLTLIKSQKTA